MRLTKVSGIESNTMPIDELAAAVEAEFNNRALELKNEEPGAIVIGTSVKELSQGLLITLLYETPS